MRDIIRFAEGEFPWRFHGGHARKEIAPITKSFQASCDSANVGRRGSTLAVAVLS